MNKKNSNPIGKLYGFPVYVTRMVVYTGGTFDVFHFGHVNFLRECYKEFGAKVTVALNTDAFCRQYKRRPIMNYNQRKEMLESCKYVQEVVKNTGGFDSKPAILKVKPDYIVHGDDWTGEKYMKQLGINKRFLKKHKIKLEYIPYTKGISTTELINKIKKSK